MIKAVFPGSFDPPTHGHLDIIRRSARIFDSLDVVIAVNHHKAPLLSTDERKRLLLGEIAAMSLKNVAVAVYEGLVVEYCRSVKATVLLRGLRSSSDYNYEFELSIINKQLDEGIETVMIPAAAKYFILKSSTIKELLNLGGDISHMVPHAVEMALLSCHGDGAS